MELSALITDCMHQEAVDRPKAPLVGLIRKLNFTSAVSSLVAPITDCLRQAAIARPKASEVNDLKKYDHIGIEPRNLSSVHFVRIATDTTGCMHQEAVARPNAFKVCSFSPRQCF